MRSKFLGRLLTATLCGCLTALAGAGESYPSQPIQLILPAPPGGFLDSVARRVSQELHDSMGATVVIRNESAGNGVVAANIVATAKPDGYTIGWVQGSQLTMVPHFVKVPFKIDQFEPVSLLYRGPMLLSVNQAVPAHNLKELIAYVNKSGTPLPVGVSANGGLAHLTTELFSQASKTPTQAVPYRGEAPIVVDLLAGNLPAAMTTLNAVSQHASKGLVRILAVSSEQRTPAIPDVPTFKESGYPEVVTSFWHGIVAPKGTPRPIIDKLNAALAKAVRSDGLRKIFTEDIEIVTSSPEEFGSVIRKDDSEWGALIKARHPAGVGEVARGPARRDAGRPPPWPQPPWIILRPALPLDRRWILSTSTSACS